MDACPASYLQFCFITLGEMQQSMGNGTMFHYPHTDPGPYWTCLTQQCTGTVISLRYCNFAPNTIASASPGQYCVQIKSQLYHNWNGTAVNSASLTRPLATTKTMRKSQSEGDPGVQFGGWYFMFHSPLFVSHSIHMDQCMLLKLFSILTFHHDEESGISKQNV